MCTTVRTESGHREHCAFAFFFLPFFKLSFTFFFFYCRASCLGAAVWSHVAETTHQRQAFHRLLNEVKVAQSCLTLQPHGLFVEFSRPEYWSGWPFPSPEDLPNPGIKPWFPALQVDSLPAEPLGKPKNTGVGSLSLFQGNVPTQESNQGLLHCRRILDH